MSDITVEALDESIREHQKLVDFGQAIERLRKNTDFKKVVVDGYLKNEALRVVHLKADPNFQTPERRATLERQLDAIAFFGDYLNTQMIFAERAVRQITDAERTREEILAEGN